MNLNAITFWFILRYYYLFYTIHFLLLFNVLWYSVFKQIFYLFLSYKIISFYKLVNIFGKNYIINLQFYK